MVRVTDDEIRQPIEVMRVARAMTLKRVEVVAKRLACWVSRSLVARIVWSSASLLLVIVEASSTT
ncbi:MAG: hypothetical protein RI897_153 [Verrucomicrobiota bacterium]